MLVGVRCLFGLRYPVGGLSDARRIEVSGRRSPSDARRYFSQAVELVLLIGSCSSVKL